MVKKIEKIIGYRRFSFITLCFLAVGLLFLVSFINVREGARSNRNTQRNTQRATELALQAQKTARQTNHLGNGVVVQSNPNTFH